MSDWVTELMTEEWTIERLQVFKMGEWGMMIEWINQSVNQSINQSMNKSVSELVDEWVNQSVSEWGNNFKQLPDNRIQSESHLSLDN